MPRLFIKNLGIEIDAEEGETILDALTRNQIYIDAPCGGLGICGKCRVKVNGKSILSCTSRVEGNFSLEIKEDKPNLKILRESKEENEGFGLAFDIGTTTILSAFTSLKGEILAIASITNPQRIFGADVITRIYRSSTEGKLQILKGMVVKEMEEITKIFLTALRVKEEKIKFMVVVGNPAMVHIFLGIDPSPLGVFPYIPQFKGGLKTETHETGFSFSSPLYIPPFPSGFIGADAIAGVLFSEFYRASSPSLYMDIGTNGEILLNDGKGFIGCSVPAGPVFEGGNLSCGMRAEDGAIERVWFEDRVKFNVIGNRPIGICGSGFIDAISEMLRNGIIGRDGKFSERIPFPFEKNFDKDKRIFYLSRDVFITQKDIRQFQLAKSAVQSAVKILLKESGIKIGEIEEIILTGGFGRSINRDAFIRCGFIPEGFKGEIKFLENSALNGAILFIKHFEWAKNGADEIISKLKTIELAMNEEFEKIFLESINF